MRCPRLVTKVVNQLMDEIIAVPVIQLECSVAYRHIVPIPSFIAAGSQTDRWTLRWFDFDISK